MKFLRLLFLSALISIIIAATYSCSAEEDNTSTPNDTFESLKSEVSVIKYTITASASGGGVVSSSGGTYEKGTKVSITAVPDDGYKFVGWAGSNSNSTTLEITINSNLVVQAIFELKPVLQKGYDQSPVSYAKIAVIPIDFNDTPDEYKQMFPTKTEIKNLLIDQNVVNFFDDSSYGIFKYDVDVFDYFNLQISGYENDKLFSIEDIINQNYVIDGLEVSNYDHFMFVPIHDAGLVGAVMNAWAIKINGVNFEYGDINSFIVPVHIGYLNRDTQYKLSNSIIDKQLWDIPTGETSYIEGSSKYPFSDFQSTFMHEFIHALGIQTHSRSRTNGERFDYQEEITNNNGLLDLDYGDVFCIMGTAEWAISLTAVYRDFLGWHNDTVRERILEYGKHNVTLHSLNSRDKKGYVEIRIPGAFNEFSNIGYKNKGYFLEIRSKDDPWSSFLDHNELSENLQGVFIRKTDGYASWLLDASPTPNINYFGTTTPDIRDVVLKQDLSYENEEIKITVLSKNSDGSYDIEITIKD